MKKIAVLFVLILAFCGCENSSEPSLEERFSCKVDGKLFVAKPDDNSVLGKRNLSIYYYNAGSNPSYFLSIVATGYDTTFVNLGCDSATTINKAYPISKTSGFSSPRGDFSSNAQGTMTLTNISGGSIAGTFQFTAKNRDGSKTVTVTDGKFNSTYISR